MANTDHISIVDPYSESNQKPDEMSDIGNLENLLISFENLTNENLDILHCKCSEYLLALKECKPNEFSVLTPRWPILYLRSGKILSELSVLSTTLLYFYCRYLLMSHEKIQYNLVICLLERVLKSSPTNSHAWNELGECYWNMGQTLQARDSFLASIQHDSRSKEGLRNLAIIFRQLHPPSSTEYMDDLKISFKYAQLAVDCDKDDGISWMILGNTILSEHFHSKVSSPSLLKKCLVCYRIAENDLLATKTPDFYNNLGTVYICLENYTAAIKNFSEAAKLDKLSDFPQKKLSSLRETFSSLHKVVELSRKLPRSEIYIYAQKCEKLPTDKRYSAVNIRNLQLDECNSSTSCITLCVIQVISQSELISCLAVCVDSKCSVGICNLHGIKQTGVLTKGDLVTIFSPVLKKQVIETECGIRIHSPWISCTNPELLKVNGNFIPQEFILKAMINIKAYT